MKMEICRNVEFTSLSRVFFLHFLKNTRNLNSCVTPSLTDYAIMVNKSKQIKSFVSFVYSSDCGQKGQRAKNGFAFKTN